MAKRGGPGRAKSRFLRSQTRRPPAVGAFPPCSDRGLGCGGPDRGAPHVRPRAIPRSLSFGGRRRRSLSRARCASSEDGASWISITEVVLIPKAASPGASPLGLSSLPWAEAGPRLGLAPPAPGGVLRLKVAKIQWYAIMKNNTEGKCRKAQ